MKLKIDHEYKLKRKIPATYLKWGGDGGRDREATMPTGKYTYLGENRFAVSNQAQPNHFVSLKHHYAVNDPKDFQYFNEVDNEKPS